MNPTQKDQKLKEPENANQQDQVKGSQDPSKTVRRNDDPSLGETKVEPTPPDTPDIPTPPNPSSDPRREYDDTGHEHVHHPPKGETSSQESMTRLYENDHKPAILAYAMISLLC